MAAPPHTSTDNDPLQGIVQHARARGHRFVVLALGFDEETADARGSVEVALGTLEVQRGVEEVAASLGAPGGGAPLGLLCAIAAPGSDAVAYGNAVAAAVRRATPVRVGVATSAEHPDLTLDDAIAVALEGLDVARSCGSESAVHTELYELVLRADRSHRVTRGGASPVAAPAARADVEPTAEADDPFARMASVPAMVVLDAVAPRAGAARTAPVPARDRTALAEEVEKLRADVDRGKDGNRHAQALMERRLVKLVAELETAEAEVRRLREERGADPGRASIYREVQGLDDQEPLAPVKRRLIDGVFRDNVPDDSGSTASRQ